MPRDNKKQDWDCCAAPGWPEHGRERIDPIKRPVLERRTKRRMPNSGPINYNHEQYLSDVEKRECRGQVIFTNYNVVAREI